VTRGRFVTLTLVLAVTAGCGASGSGESARQEQVAERGRTVMPFDLDRTTHTFTPTSDGLVETVTADRVDDTEQITLIRAHLAAETRRFRAGDFSDPARIHGPDMPGLAQLADGASRLEITYEDLPAGALIRFRTSEPALVAALHAWGAAQTSDHGSHATN
jgi:hypothetical protein